MPSSTIPINMYPSGANKPYEFAILNAIPSLGFNAIFGAFFGLLAAMFFGSIPGNRILKGLAIGLIYCLFSSLQPVYSYWAFDNPVWAMMFLVQSPIDKFIYGIVFVFLYKPAR